MDNPVRLQLWPQRKNAATWSNAKMPETCRFLITKINNYKLPFVNASYIFYSLAKVASKLEGYKTARACYEKLSQLIVNPKWQ